MRHLTQGNLLQLSMKWHTHLDLHETTLLLWDSPTELHVHHAGHSAGIFFCVLWFHDNHTTSISMWEIRKLLHTLNNRDPASSIVGGIYIPGTTKSIWVSLLLLLFLCVCACGGGNLSFVWLNKNELFFMFQFAFKRGFYLCHRRQYRGVWAEGLKGQSFSHHPRGPSNRTGQVK